MLSMGKSTISMVIFDSYVKLPEGYFFSCFFPVLFFLFPSLAFVASVASVAFVALPCFTYLSNLT